MVPSYVTRVSLPSPSGQQLTCITGKYDIHVSCRHQCTATEPRATRISVLIPHHARMRMVFGTITKNLDNPDAWVQACLRIYEQHQRIRFLLRSASVHGRDRGRPLSADRGTGAFAAQVRSPARSAATVVTESLGTMAHITFVPGRMFLHIHGLVRWLCS